MRISADPLDPAEPGPAVPKATRETSVQTVEKTLAILETVAARGSATAKEVAETLGYPLPTAYRLLQALVHADYLVHRRDERRFTLGDKLEALAMSARARSARAVDRETFGEPRPATG